MENSQCPVCAKQLSSGYVGWHRRCAFCGYEQSLLTPAINTPSAHQSVEEGAREAGLQAVRLANFRQLMTELQRLKPAGGALLDVGCAHGWFLEAAQSHFSVVGLEPDRAIFSQTSQRGLPVRNGYFPAALQAGERFDVIAFNDVIEHIPDIKAILAACRRHLNPEGILLLNLPNSRGVFYRLASALCRVGAPSFFDRLWQKGMPSPHVHYFHPDNLTSLLRASGFDVVDGGRLATLRLRGLYQRIAYDGGRGKLMGGVVFAGVLAAMPFIRLLPGDIMFVIARATEPNGAGGLP